MRTPEASFRRTTLPPDPHNESEPFSVEENGKKRFEPYWEEFKETFVETVGIMPRFFRRALSPTARRLFLAMAACSVPHRPMHTWPGITSEEIRVERANSRAEHLPRRQEEALIDVQGFERVGLNSERHARGLAEVLRPVLRRDSYSLAFSPQRKTADDVYFGLEPSLDQSRQLSEVWGDCTHLEGDEGSQITIYAAAAWNDEYTDFPNVRTMVETEMHEIMHTHENRELAYFIQRVKSKDRIRFPYPEHFLAARDQHRAVLWESMANEYRSELFRVLTSLPEIPAGSTIEDVAVQYVNDHFPDSSPEAVRQDIRALSLQNPQIEWPTFLKLNRAFQQETVIESAQTLARRRYIDPIPDANLRELLTDILDRPAPTEAMQLTHALAVAAQREGDVEASPILTNLSEYQRILGDQILTQDLPNQVLLEWQDLTIFVQRLNQARFKMLSVEAGFPDTQPQTEEQIAQNVRVAFEHIQDSCFLEKYQSLSSSEREHILPALREIASIWGDGFVVPEIFRVLAEPYLGVSSPPAVMRSH